MASGGRSVLTLLMARIAASVSAYAVSKTRFASGRVPSPLPGTPRSSAASADPLGITLRVRCGASTFSAFQSGCARVLPQRWNDLHTHVGGHATARKTSGSSSRSAGLASVDLATVVLQDLLQCAGRPSFNTSFNISISIFVNFSTTLSVETQIHLQRNICCRECCVRLATTPRPCRALTKCFDASNCQFIACSESTHSNHLDLWITSLATCG